MVFLEGGGWECQFYFYGRGDFSEILLFETQGRQTFEGGHELFGHHPFACKTPTPLGGLRTQEVNICALFSCLSFLRQSVSHTLQFHNADKICKDQRETAVGLSLRPRFVRFLRKCNDGVSKEGWRVSKAS